MFEFLFLPVCFLFVPFVFIPFSLLSPSFIWLVVFFFSIHIFFFYTVQGILQVRILDGVAVPFSRGSFQPRDWTHISCLAGRFFTSWATRVFFFFLSSFFPRFFFQVFFLNSSFVVSLLIFWRFVSSGDLSAHVCVLSYIWLLATPWTKAHQASLSMEFSRYEYWSRLPFPTSGDLPDLGIEPASPASLALAGRLFTIALLEIAQLFLTW